MDKKNDIKILIVEDEEDQRIRLKYVLESYGYNVEEADSAEHAVKMMTNSKKYYNLVVSDMKMPGNKSGLDVLKKAKEINENTEVFIITAYGSVDNAVKAMVNGAFDYIQKPINMPELRIKIERAIDNRSLIRKADGNEILKTNIKALYNDIDDYKAKLSEINDISSEILSQIQVSESIFTDINDIYEMSKVQ